MEGELTVQNVLCICGEQLLRALLFWGDVRPEVSWLGLRLDLVKHRTQCCAGLGPIVGRHRQRQVRRSVGVSVRVKVQWSLTANPQPPTEPHRDHSLLLSLCRSYSCVLV